MSPRVIEVFRECLNQLGSGTDRNGWWDGVGIRATRTNRGTYGHSQVAQSGSHRRSEGNVPSNRHPEPFPQSARPWADWASPGAADRVVRPCRSASWRGRGARPPGRPGLAAGVPSEDDHIRGQRSVVQKSPRVDTVSDGIPHQTSPGLLSVISRRPDHATDMLTWVTVASVDLDSDPFIVRRQRRIKLGRIVVNSHCHIAPLPPLRVEAIVLQHPSPRRVVVGIHHRHIDHLPSYPRPANTISASEDQPPGGKSG